MIRYKKEAHARTQTKLRALQQAALPDSLTVCIWTDRAVS